MGRKERAARVVRPDYPEKSVLEVLKASRAKRERKEPGASLASGATKATAGDKGETGETGAIGPEGVPGLLPMIEEYQVKKVYYRAQCVTLRGSCYQAIRDTGEPPPDRESWLLVASSGRDGVSPEVRGTYDRAGDYRCLDIVMKDGSSFIAKRDAPGECPSDGWQCLAMVGKRGEQGQAGTKGAKGDKGERGERGAAGVDGKAAVFIVGWRVDRDLYLAIPILSDRSEGPPLELRPLFEQFQSEVE